MEERILKRDLVGYGAKPLHPQWPDSARVAINFAINYEEGAERSPLIGDDFAETYGAEFPLTQKPAGERHLSTESLFEYGSRAGIWRLLKLFEARGLNTTIFATGLALSNNIELAKYLAASNHEVAGHGWRWIDYSDIDLEIERAHIAKTTELIQKLTGKISVGWYTGRRSSNTRDLLAAHGSFLYDSESYADDLPYYVDVQEKPHLVIPYNLDCNDFRFTTSPGFSSSADFYFHLRDTFDQLWSEGADCPKMMSVGLHGRIGGRPARAAAVEKFLEHVLKHDQVWICRRDEIARHWLETHPPTEI